MFKDETFPKCSRCRENVIFKIMQQFPGLDVSRAAFLFLSCRLSMTDLELIQRREHI
jgi:hypothetical protein